MSENQRTYGGSGRHTIPGHGVRVLGSPDDIRKVLRRARDTASAPLWFDTLDIDPTYVGRHRPIVSEWECDTIECGYVHADCGLHRCQCEYAR